MSVKSRPSQAVVEERRRAILSRVADAGEIRIAELAEHFNVSLMTMHRDLDQLASRNLLRKERGLAVAFPMLTMETATRFREGVNRELKAALCAAAVRYIKSGGTILVDDSSTVLPLAAELRKGGIEQLGVVTNSLGVAERMAEELPRADLTLLGGRFQSEFNSCTGPEVTRVLARTHVDLVLMSATAVLGGNLYHPVREVAEIKEAMLASGSEALLLIDHTKFGKAATHMHGSVAAFRAVITDAETSTGEIFALRETGVAVDVIDPNPSA